MRHATQAGDWQLAASLVVDGLAISEIIEPRDGQSLAREFARMPNGGAWTSPQPYLVAAAAALAAGAPESCAAAVEAAEGMVERLPSGQEAAARLAAAAIRLAAARRTGDLSAAETAVSQAEALITIQFPVTRPEPSRISSTPVYPGCRTNRYGPEVITGCSALVITAKVKYRPSVISDQRRIPKPATNSVIPTANAAPVGRIAADGAERGADTSNNSPTMVPVIRSAKLPLSALVASARRCRHWWNSNPNEARLIISQRCHEQYVHPDV